MKMRVVCFTESMAGGGAEHQLLVLAQLLKKNNYNVSIVTYADVEDHYEIPASIQRIRIKRSNSKILKFFYIFFFFLSIKADCVISYRQACNARVLLPLMFRTDVKVICSERNCTWGKPSIYERLLFGFLYYRANFIVPNSFKQSEYILKKKPYLKMKLKTITNYTDVNYFKYTHIPESMDIIKICVFSRYSKQKNAIGLAKAISLIKGRTNKKFEVHWYGSQYEKKGEFDRDYKEVLNYVEDQGISNILILKPAVKDPSLLMSHYHGFCLPSLFEGFSNSIAEAICCGKPMLVSDVSDNHIMVHQNKNGFLFDPLNTESISEAFINFLNLTYDQLVDMSYSSRAIAEELFNENEFMVKYKNLIDN